MNQYNTSEELMHYGVKGMKWGQRRAQKYEARTARKYARAGKSAGYAEYQRNKGSEAYKKHAQGASVLEKAAKQYDAKGNVFKAEAARKAASALRTRGENVRARYDSDAARYERKAQRITEKASTYATKKRVDLGKSRIDSILKESKKKGYESAKLTEENMRQYDIEKRFGEKGVKAYNYARGTDW